MAGPYSGPTKPIVLRAKWSQLTPPTCSSKVITQKPGPIEDAFTSLLSFLDHLHRLALFVLRIRVDGVDPSESRKHSSCPPSLQPFLDVRVTRNYE